MPQEMQGRRVPVINLGTHPDPMVGEAPILERAGDYCGPLKGFTGEKPAVFFLLPVARDAGVAPEGRSMHHVVSPPHVFTENPDGTLTIRESIGAQQHWHGFLTKGRWQLKRD